MKWHNLYAKLLSYRRLYEAWEKVKSNGGTGGMDDVSIKSFEENAESNLQEILKELKNKTYRPKPVKRRYILKKNGKQRPLGLPTIKDKIVQQAVVNILSPLYETIFHSASVGFRPEKGAYNAFGRIVNLMENGYVWIHDADVKGYFDCIDHRLLMKMLKGKVADHSILNLVWQWLKAGVIEEGVITFSKTGTPQGGVISPLLANIYLNELDWKLHNNGIQMVRYADDFIVFAKDEASIKQAEIIVEEGISSLKLTLSPEKTHTSHLMEKTAPNGRIIPELNFLGVTFQGWFRKRNGDWSYGIKCSPEAMKSFRQSVKETTPKSLTQSLEVLVKNVNPIIRGKANYWAQAARAVNTYRAIKGNCRCAMAILGQQAQDLDAYVRTRLRRCRLPARGGSKTYRRAKMLESIYTHEKFIGASLCYVERTVRDAFDGNPMSNNEFLSVIQGRRDKQKERKQNYKTDDPVYWDRRRQAYARAQERVMKYKSK
jgi:RNA-directed DNA polymerase